jgi:MoaA/NifB/PqqE/SkfB family radical SAM enzyme
MSGIFPFSVDFIVTSECNLHCPVCWGSGMPEYSELPLEKRLEAVEVLNKGGAVKAVFTGGEPLLDKNLPELMKKAKSLGMETLLFTNCTLMKERADEILPYTDYISMSLDGYDEKSNCSARKEGHFTAVMDMIKLLKEKYSGKKVQVLTVMTKINKGYVGLVGLLLEQNTKGMRFHWKLNHYKPIGRFNERFMLEYCEFEGLAGEIKQVFEGRINVRYSIPEHDRGYLFVFPDAQMYTTESRNYVSAGNVLKPETYRQDIFRDIEKNMLERDLKVKGEVKKASITS